MATTDEEFQDFVANNRELIELMMRMKDQAPAADKVEGTASRIVKAVDEAEANADRMRQKTEEFIQDTYKMVMHPDVQRHFMKMGMEFMMAVSAMMQNAPTPDFMKESVADMEKNWKKTSCSMNEECEVRKSNKPNKVTIESEEPRKTVSFDDMDE